MASAKQCDDSSEWESAPTTKRARASQESDEVGLQDNEGNYRTLSSQRPTRNRKPPERFIDLPSQPAHKKAKASPKKAATKPNSNPSPRKSDSAIPFRETQHEEGVLVATIGGERRSRAWLTATTGGEEL
jgi:hypothetical protein